MNKTTGTKTFPVTVTQYVRTDGHAVSRETDLPINVQSEYAAMCAAGCRLASEVLRTGEVSISIENADQDGDLAGKTVPNGPQVQAAIVEMLQARPWEPKTWPGKKISPRWRNLPPTGDITDVTVEYHEYDCGSPCTPSGCPGHVTDMPVGLVVGGVQLTVENASGGDFPTSDADYNKRVRDTVAKVVSALKSSAER